jgi:hypothetical protein
MALIISLGFLTLTSMALAQENANPYEDLTIEHSIDQLQLLLTPLTQEQLAAEEFGKAGVSIPLPQRDVYLYSEKTE